jgi:hypothetical protein
MNNCSYVCLSCLQVAIRVLAAAVRPELPNYNELPPMTSRICKVEAVCDLEPAASH